MLHQILGVAFFHFGRSLFENVLVSFFISPQHPWIFGGS